MSFEPDRVNVLTRLRQRLTMCHMSDIANDNGIPELTLGWRLRMAMERAGIKAADMADQLGVHGGTITRWTHDIGSPPRPIYLERWAELCNVPLSWLAGTHSPFATRPAVRRTTSSTRRTSASTWKYTATTRGANARRAVSCAALAA